MSKKFTLGKVLLTGAAAAVAYKFVKGDGVFNKPRFYPQYDAIKKYVATNYPDATIGEIVKTAEGWSCLVYDDENTVILYLTRSENKEFIFDEKQL